MTASNTPTPSPAPAAAPVETKEKPTTHGKKAQFVAIALIGVLLAGLVVQSYINWQKREQRQAKQEQKEDAAEARQAKPRASTTINDFANESNAAAANLDNGRNQQDEEARKKNRLKNLEHSYNNADASGDTSTGAAGNGDAGSMEDMTRQFQIAEMKRALEAGRGKIGHLSAADTRQQQGGTGTTGLPSARSGPGQNNGPAAGASAELARVDERIRALQATPTAIDQKKKELLERVNALGVTLPPEVMARLTQSSSGAPAAAPNQVQAQQPAGRANPQPQAGGIPTFGELAPNRVARDPTNGGPRPGESIISTGSIIDALLDMDLMSDYDGNFIAVLQRPFYDESFENILLPIGTKITGKTKRISGVNEFIQNRMALTPLWAIRPDKKRIDFRRTGAMDLAGVGAIQGGVDRHLVAQVLGVGAYALLGLGPSMSNYGAQPNSSRDAFVREVTSQARDNGRAFANKYLSIVPTITLKAGTPIKIFIEDDIYVTPWTSVDAAHFTPVQ